MTFTDPFGNLVSDSVGVIRMKITYFTTLKKSYRIFLANLADFSSFFFHYCKRKVVNATVAFEKYKNRFVRIFMAKRGRYNRPFLHFATMTVLGLGVLIGPFLAETYPVFSSNTSTVLGAQRVEQQSVIVGEDVFQTDVSAKPRDKVLTYTVQKGDTLSTIAKKYQISEDTIRWSNDITGDAITVGDELKILPVSGIAHKVQKGDTVYTIAKKYTTDAQKIVDFPFNDFANPETFALVEGQMLVVPDGIKPSEQPLRRNDVPRVFVAAPVPIAGGSFAFPLPSNTGISQFASWYHMALDITAPYGTPIYSAQNGTVTRVSVGTYDSGYGNNVWVSNGNGVETHYAHMMSVNVSAGQSVSSGSTVIGWVGLTGRTTGPHLHFEIRQNGSLVDPMTYLR